MNADELRFMLKNAVRTFLDPETVRDSETVETSMLRQNAAMRDMLDQLKRFVNADELHAECLCHAESFIQKKQYRPAMHTCLAVYWESQNAIDRAVEAEKARIARSGKMAEIVQTATEAEGTATDRLGHRIRATICTAICKFFLTVESDARMESRKSLEDCVSALREISQAMKSAFKCVDQLYHLIYNGTLVLVECCATLMTLGYYRQAAVFIGWSCKCMDSVISLSSVKYLGWRVRLYTTLCFCYECLEEYEGSLTIAQYLLQRVEQLQELEGLDVVPPSDVQILEMRRASESAKLLVMKYAWAAQLSPSDAHDAQEDQQAGKGQAAGKKMQAGAHPEKDLVGIPTNVNDLLEKLRVIYAAGAGDSTSATHIITALLKLFADGSSRLFTPPDGRRAPAGRATVSSTAAEALSHFITPFVDEHVRRNESIAAGKKWEFTDEAHPEDAKESKKVAKASKEAKGKAAALSAAAKDETPRAAKPATLEEVTDLGTLLLVCRTLYSLPETMGFEKCLACLTHLLGITRVPVGTIGGEAQLLASLHALRSAAESQHQREERIIDLAQDLRLLLHCDPSFASKRPDIVEDAALFALHSWSASVEHWHEAPGAENVLSAVVLALIASRHSDILLIANIALTVVRRMEALDKYTEALHLMTRVEKLLAERQAAFVFSHDNTDVPLNILAETLNLKNTVTRNDGMWLRTLRDYRTETHRVLCRLRLQCAVNLRHSELVAQHQSKVTLLHERQQKSLLLGQMTRREKRAMSTLDAHVVEKPCTVEEMERKLLAWSNSSGSIAIALARMEIAKCQRGHRFAKDHLVAAQAALLDATAHHTKITRACGIVKQNAAEEPTSATGFSLCYAWACFAHTCHQCNALDLVGPAEKNLFDRFVITRDDNPAPWDANVCAWDTLRDDTVNRCSDVMLDVLCSAFIAIAARNCSVFPALQLHEFVDDEEYGLDQKRFSVAKQQHTWLRSANTLIHAVEFGIVARNEQVLYESSVELYNCLLPTLNAKEKPLLLLRPIIALINSFTSYQLRRWENVGLQHLASRVFHAAFDLCHFLPEASQKPITISFAQSFCDVWKLVIAHPNEMVRRHQSHVVKELDIIARYSALLKQEDKAKTEGAPAAADATAAKAAKGAKGATKKEPTAAAVDPKVTIFFRSDVSFSDKMPLEYLELMDRILFEIPAALSVAEARNEADNLFPPWMVSLAAALQSSPQAAVVKMTENKGELLYTKVASMVVGELMKRRLVDAAVSLAEDAMKEVARRQSTIATLEAEAMKSLQDQIQQDHEAAAAKGEITSRLTARMKSVRILSRRIAMFRRKIAFRKLRAAQLQYDRPHHAMLQLQLSAIAFFKYCREDQRNRKSYDGVSQPKPHEPASQKPHDGPKKAPPSKQLAAKGAGKQEESKTPRPNEPDDSKPTGENDPIATLQSEVLTAAARALALFGRCGKWMHFVSALQFSIDAARVMLGDRLPSVLSDVARAQTAGGDSSPSSTHRAQSLTPLVTQQVAAANTAANAVLRVEKPLKMICVEVLNLLMALECGAACPADEVDFLHAPAIKCLSDFIVEGGMLARTTSLNMLRSAEGQRIFKMLKERDMLFEKQIRKVFVRERCDVEEAETSERIDVMRQWLSDWHAVAGWELFEEDLDRMAPRYTDSRISVPKLRRANPVVQEEKLDEIAPGSTIPYSHQLGGISLQELLRCFMYAAQCLQYGKRKPSALQLCLEFNTRTRNAFAVAVLPFVIALQNATSVSFDASMQLYAAAYREQLRTRKLVEAAKRAWVQYKETDKFKQIMAKLLPALLTARRQESVAGTHETESVHTHSSAVGFSGGSVYKEVVQSYAAAISYLRQKHSTQLLVGMLCELGTIHALHRNRTEAARAWCDCVDAAVGRVNVLTSWRDVLTELGDAAATKIGLWKLLASVTALGNLAMYIYGTRQQSATEACLLAAELLWRFSSCSLSMPQRHWDEAYTSVRELCVGISLESENEVTPDMTHRLLYIAYHLLENGFAVQCITVANVLEHFAIGIARSVELTVKARCLKAQAASMIGNFTQAFSLLLRVLRGSSLPDQSFGQFNYGFDVLDKADRIPTATAVQKRGAGKPDPKGKGAVEEDKKKGDENEVPLEYDNSKSAFDETNLRVIEAVASSLNGQSYNLADAVAAEYGLLLSRQVLMAVMDVLLSTALQDPLLSWGCTERETSDVPAAKGAKIEKAKATTAEARAMENNVCAAALSLADKIAAFMFRVAPRGTGVDPTKPPGAAAARMATPQAAGVRDTPIPYASPAEEQYMRQKGRYYVAMLAIARGNWLKGFEFVDEIVASLNAGAEIAVSLIIQHTPSFTYSISSRFACAMHTLRAELLCLMRRYNASLVACKEGLQLAKDLEDSFSACVLQRLLATVHYRRGSLDEAMTGVVQLISQTRDLEWDGTSDYFACSLLAKFIWNVETSIVPHLNNAAMMREYYVPEKPMAKVAFEELELAVRILTTRCQHLGLNLRLTQEWEGAFQRYNPSIPQLHVSLNVLGAALMRKAMIEEAEKTLRTAIQASEQGDSQRYPMQLAMTKYLLASLLRQKAHPNVALPSSPTEMDGATDFASSALVNDERHNLLTSAVEACVANGAHDYELIRLMFIELFLLYASSGTPPHALAAYQYLKLACRASRMQQIVFQQPSLLGDVALTGLEDALPAAVLDELEDLSRRDQSAQSEFLLRTDKSKNPAKQPVTLSLLLMYFAMLQLEYRTAPPWELRSLEAKLIKVRHFLQSKAHDPPTVLDKVPQVFSTAPLGIKSFSVISQCFVADTIHTPTQPNDSGVRKTSQPTVSLLLGLVPFERADDAAREETGKPGAKERKPPAGKSGDAGTADDTKAALQRLPVIACFNFPQKRLASIYQRAKELHATYQRLQESNVLEEHTDITGGKDKDGAKKGAGKPSAGKDDKAKPSEQAPTGDRATTPEAGRQLDMQKSELLMEFLEMVVNSKQVAQGRQQQAGAALDAEVENLFPKFGFQPQHISLLADIFHISGGATSITASAPEMCQWLCEIVNYFNR